MNSQLYCACVVWVSLIVCNGCSRSDLPKTIPVTGIITLDGATLPKPGTIFFTCVEPHAGYPNRPGIAKFNEDGVFVATSYYQGDGLVPGTYRISVECWEVPPSFDGPPAKSIIPSTYLNPSGSDLEKVVILPTDDHRKIVIDIKQK